MHRPRDPERSASCAYCLLPTSRDGAPLMSSTLATLILAAALTAQHPTAGSPAAPAMSAEEVARLEVRSSDEHSPGDLGFARARRGLFQPRRPCDHLPGGARTWLHRSSTTPSPTRTAIRSIRALSTRFAGQDGQHRQRALHLPVLPPERQVDPVCLDPPEPQHRGRSPPRARPTAGPSAIAGNFPSRWTSSPPTSTARTWCA